MLLRFSNLEIEINRRELTRCAVVLGVVKFGNCVWETDPTRGAINGHLKYMQR